MTKVETDMISIKSEMLAINATIYNIEDLLQERTVETEKDEVFDMPDGVSGYLNRLDQIQNYTVQLNHRIRDLEIKQATNPREFMKQMSIMFTERISVGCAST